MVLSMLKENSGKTEMYTKLAKTLKNTEGCVIRNKIFTSSSKISQDITDGKIIENTDFSKNKNGFTVSVNKYGHLRHHEFTSKTETIYANICTFQSLWPLDKDSNVMSKLYNSHNYSDDIRYEGRLLEMPLETNGFKLVLVLPNPDEVLKTLFDRLASDGLAAAINSIQPLFVAETAMGTPVRAEIRSKIEIDEKTVSEGLTIQYGSIEVSDLGTRVRILTCVYVPESSVHDNGEHLIRPKTPPPQSPSYFAVVYHDTPIFYGDFNKPIKLAK